MPRIYIVEDDPKFAYALSSLLKKHGYDVTSGVTAIEAFRELSTEKYSLILADLQLPDVSGISLVRWLRSSSVNDQTPVIAVSGHPEKRGYAIQAGFQMFIVKPPDPDMLLAVIKDWVGE